MSVEPRIAEIARRIQSLRLDLDLSVEQMAATAGVSEEEYLAAEGGERDLSFTFLYRCAEKFGVDIVELLTGESPHLTGYSVVRAGQGLSIRRREGFEYRHLASTFAHKLAEPFFVTAPFLAEAAEAPIALSKHAGQEFDYVLSGKLRFAHEGHTEELAAGDAVFYDSGRGHGMVAVGDEPCTFLAIVLKDREEGVA